MSAVAKIQLVLPMCQQDVSAVVLVRG